ncbi:hypothetical protein SpCBS45565_g07023 [Spizellomyces sp. 'palustris']|nr:hypothetical protein SpCBS45565_g07023 [Spizellomyces sp. 'palustris']
MTSIDDLDLPRSIIGRVIKNALPEGAQVQKDAKAAMTKACTVFINYLTATALDVTKHSDRKSISANDIFRALAILEFDQFLPMIKVAVEEFQQKAKEKRQEYKRNFKEKHRVSNAATASADEEGDAGYEGDTSMAVDEPVKSERVEGSGSIPQKRKSNAGTIGSIKRPKLPKGEGGVENGSDHGSDQETVTDQEGQRDGSDQEDAESSAGGQMDSA